MTKSRIGDRADLEAFVRCVELGSLSAAARELDVTPSALSKLLSRLEKSLRVRLVSRTTRSVAATAEGQLFLSRCRRILAEMEDTEMELGRARDAPRGRLRMHSGVGFGISQLAPALPRFLARYPEIQLDLSIKDGYIDIVKEGLDISISPWPANVESLVVRPLFEFDRVVCAAPAYLKRRGVPRTPDDLLRHRCMRVSTVAASNPWRFREPGGAKTIDVVPYIAADNADIVYRFALEGVGVIQLMEYIVADAIKAGRLVRVLADWHHPAGLTMFAAYAHERHRLPRVRAMLDFLAQTFGSRPWRRGPNGTV